MTVALKEETQGHPGFDEQIKKILGKEEYSYQWAKDGASFSAAPLGRLKDDSPSSVINGCVVFLLDPKKGGYPNHRPKIILATADQVRDIDPQKLSVKPPTLPPKYEEFRTAITNS